MQHVPTAIVEIAMGVVQRQGEQTVVGATRQDARQALAVEFPDAMVALHDDMCARLS